MKRWMICLTLLGLFFLQGCKEESSIVYGNGYQSDLKAKAEDLDGYILDSGTYKLHIEDDHMIVIGKISSNNPVTGESDKHVLDEIFEAQGMKPFDSIFEEYDDVKIKTKGNVYTISVNDFSIQFLKFKEHILVDKNGHEYIRNKLPK